MDIKLSSNLKLELEDRWLRTLTSVFNILPPGKKCGLEITNKFSNVNATA